MSLSDCDLGAVRTTAIGTSMWRLGAQGMTYEHACDALSAALEADPALLADEIVNRTAALGPVLTARLEHPRLNYVFTTNEDEIASTMWALGNAGVSLASARESHLGAARRRALRREVT